jgi:pyruvate-ferredoxin/flavodoxin oxidoreductase
MSDIPKYPGIRITSTGNHLVAKHTEARIADGGVFYPITPSTEGGELFQAAYAEGKLNVFGRPKIAIETEGEHAAQGGSIALSVTGKRVVNFTSGQGLVYGLEQYYHAPGKLSTMIVQLGARALTKHALNVHCGHDDLYTALDTGWIMLFAKDAQQAADQTLILRRVTELSLTPGINGQDGFLTTHLERTFFMHESELIREYLGAPDDIIDTPTEAQRELFGPTRRRVPKLIDIENPVLLGPVQNQDHYMNGVIARRNNFAEPILGMLEDAYADFAKLTGRHYGMVSEYRCDDAETVFFCMGSAAENIEAAVDHLRETEDAKVGCVHLNVLRPFPVAAVVEALAGKKNVIVLERTDEALSPDNPLTREVRAALSMGRENARKLHHAGIPAISADDRPDVYSGVFGLGSRDFRPEGIFGAYEYVTAGLPRQDGKTSADGESFFVIGIDHPYAVISKKTPSLLPDRAIAVRLHSIGGWGMITTGKNLGGVIGAIADDRAQALGEVDEYGHLKEIIHISSNPKYGSEKKGSPTSYFLVAAPDRIRVNCDLRHVNVVLCCDPKAFTHMDPLDGMAEGGTFVWESDEEPAIAWQRIPPALRANIIEKKIRLCTLDGFAIARDATTREDLQLRMQGNAFLGAFFAVSGFLERFDISADRFREIVRKQYDKKFGRFGQAVVDSNMKVMTDGMTRVREVPYGAIDAPDLSSMRGTPLTPCGTCGIESTSVCDAPDEQPSRIPMVTRDKFESEYRAGYGYHQPASPLASVGVVAAAAGAQSSKYVARREKPVWIPENCTQCMECITACPDTALPNTAQEIGRVLRTAAEGYVGDLVQRGLLLKALPSLEERIRSRMNDGLAKKSPETFNAIVREEAQAMELVSDDAKAEFLEVFARIPFAYEKTPMVFGAKEGRNPGTGGLFGIFVSDLCKGCGECVAECGDKDALVMRPETEELGADHVSGINFMDLLPDTPPEFLGRFDPENPADSHAVTLKNHLMVRSLYEALVSGDGACAGCGEKSALRAIATLTEAYMRPIYKAKADRLRATANRLVEGGAARMAEMRERSPEEHALFRKSVLHVVMGYGGESEEDTAARMAAVDVSDADIVDALVQVMRQDAFNHTEIQSVDGRRADGMAVMVMGAHTGCNTVYGSTPPNNPHPYPWMNSLFQDGATITWIFGESMMMDHARRSVIPERLAVALLDRDENVIDEAGYFEFTHMSDAVMTDQEIRELPKAWAVGGDGGMGDIGFQNVSKVVLQNRPNVKLLMLDTQVYSNTGGQNSDSSLMLGGFDMNQFGSVTQGKFTEKKSLSEIFTSGHGSPFVAQVSMADVASFYKAILDGLSYRGTSFIQSFTTCQPEHGVPDDMSSTQARRVRDSRGVPQFVFNPQNGETYTEAMELKGNPNADLDWARVNSKARGKGALYTVAHWATTEARFRKHLKKVKSLDGLEPLENAMARMTQQDVIHRRFVSPTHRAHVPDFGVYIDAEDGQGNVMHYAVSRQMVLFCVERRRAWRMLQSKAGQRNLEYEAQRAVLQKNAKGEISDEDLKARAAELVASELAALKSPKKAGAPGAPGGAPKAPGAPGAPKAPGAPSAPKRPQ